MKRLVVAAFIVSSIPVAARAPVDEAETTIRTVETNEGHLREGPGYVYPLATTVPLGQRLRVLEQESDFLRVEALEPAQATGWINIYEVTEMEIVLERSDKALKRRLKRGETSLAARSFSPEIERYLRRGKKHYEDGYARLDSLADDPRFDPDMVAVARFRQDGGLRPLGEG